jgi:hypothetical protein
MPETFCSDLGCHTAREHEGASGDGARDIEPRQADVIAVAG